MAGFEGKWKLETSENFDEYMKEIGVSFMIRKIAVTAKPTLILSQSDGKWTVKSESTIKNSEFTFSFNEEFEETTTDGRKVQSTITQEDETKWIHKQSGSPPSTITRQITDPNTLETICEANGVISKRVYKRVP